MNRQGWFVAGISVAVSMAIPLTISWFVERMNPVVYPGELSYKPVEDMPPRVDLASVQRGWPDSLGEPGERNRLTAYLHDMERQAPIAAATSSASLAAEAPLDLGTLLESADANAGKNKSRVCMSCHDFQQGGPDRVGPNLWGVIGRDVASRPGFAYSPAMTAQPGVWSYDQLFTYLASPARSIPGNKMAFGGLRRPEDRAAVIKYLATIGGSAPPLPQPQPRTAAPTGKP